MRFVPVNSIRDGMKCGRQLFGKNGELLLNAGSTIHASYIDKIKELGFSGIYVDDSLSADISISELINENLRHKTVKAVKDAFINIGNNKIISKKSVQTINSLVNDIIDNILSNRDFMVNIIDLKVSDDYTYYHSVNVGVLSILIGLALNLNRDRLFELGLSSILHDIGKVFIPKELLNKPGQLTDEEFDIMKTHPLKGYEYLREKFSIPSTSSIGVLQHHERVDQRGYPYGINGSRISLFGKIIAIADVYDALTSDRPYRKALLPSEAIEYIMGGNDTLFEPELVGFFIRKIAPYPIGTCVSLSNGSMGLVVENHSDCCLRPKVKIVKQGSKDIEEPYTLDLRGDINTLDIVITGVADY